MPVRSADGVRLAVSGDSGFSVALSVSLSLAASELTATYLRLDLVQMRVDLRAAGGGSSRASGV